MGFSHKSHGKRSDKETQSPMLKIFKDMMQKERRDPEKTNLINDNQKDRKRKHYSSSRSKSGHKTVSSTSERNKKKQPYMLEQQDLTNTEFDACPSQSLPFQGEKRDSWWFWGETDVKSKAEDTCSCVSCALKKLISTDYACIVCIVLLLVVSVIIAIMLVYNSIPCMAASGDHLKAHKNINPKIEIERLKRRIGGKWNFKSKKPWENPFTRSYNPDFASFKFQDSDISSLVDTESELSKILDTEKINDIQTSDRLREFYQKLIQTDAAIRNLRKTLNFNSVTNTKNTDFNINNYLNTKDDYGNNNDVNSNDLNIPASKFYPDRTKRSLKLFHRPMRLLHFKSNEHTTKAKIDNGKLITKTTVNMTNKKPTTNKSSRNKRNGQYLDSEGFVIEKNKVVIQYKPTHVVPKCSHTPTDSKSHETQMNHPFYKNTQRLDELLDQFMEKKIPDLFADRFEINTMLKNRYNPTNEEVPVKADTQNGESIKNNEDQKASGKKPKQVLKETREGEIKQIVKTEATNTFENEFLDDTENVDKKVERSSTDSYELLLSISTLLNPRPSSYSVSTVDDRGPNLRKLMQVNAKEEEGFAYQDIKVMLVDYKESPDDEHKNSDLKRTNVVKLRNGADPDMKPDMTGVHNPNWKGPMPLYPEEITQVLKKDQNPLMSPAETYNAALSLTDTEYVEDYLDNGYERLAQLAQAYSDYGVLNEKKEVEMDRKTNEKGQKKLDDRKLRLTINRLKGGLKRGIKKNAIFGRHTKAAQTSEGIRIELQPTTHSKEDNILNLKEIFNKHIKISNSGLTSKSSKFSTSQSQTLPLDDKCDKITQFDKVTHEIFKRRTPKAVLLKNYVSNEDATMDYTTDAERENVSDTKSVASSKFKRDADSYMKEKVDYLNKFNTFDNVSINDEPVKIKSEDTAKSINVTASEENDMTLSNFFKLLSNWFSTLDTMKNTSKRPLTKETAIIRRGKNVVVDKRMNDSGHSKLIPLYDSDVIENIGHRSRVLLTVETINNTQQADEHVQTDGDEELNLEASQTTESMKNMNNTVVVFEVTEPMKNIENETNLNNRKVKRQAIDDSNLIFWNDLYDEEYGIKSDPMETNVRDKHSADKNDFLKKSNTWFQDKVKQITHKFSNLGSSKDKAKAKDGVKHPKKRHAEFGSDDEFSFGKIDFPSLTAKMKEVCKKTVKAVQESKHVQVRGDGMESAATSSLMQQLVRLMTDLVDFQVQERTCRKLPPDLKQFLEWLTRNNNAEHQTDMDSYYSNKKIEEYPGVNFDKSTEQDLLQPSESENPYSKTDCLGTLQAIQDLIRQYDDMSDYDKSVMTGVRNYLENQESFLQKQLTTHEDGKLSNRDSSRFRRDTDITKTVTSKCDATVRTIEHEYKNLKKMYRNYLKKLKKGSKKVAQYLEKGSKEVKKITASVKNAVTKVGKKIEKITKYPEHKCSKVTKEKIKNKIANSKEHAATKGSKVGKEHLVDKAHLKDKVLSKERLYFKGKKRINDKGHMNAKDYVDKSVAFEAGTKFVEDYVTGENYGRNAKDNYFKSAEEADKTSTIKNGHIVGDEFFDKTDILRIDV